LSTGDSNAPGNYALLDVVAALHWIKENIGAFSGDTEAVTLLGQGHGASLVHLLMVSPVTRGTHAATDFVGSLDDQHMSTRKHEIALHLISNIVFSIVVVVVIRSLLFSCLLQ